MKGTLMRNSIRLGNVSGIPIGLHWSIAIIAGLFTMALTGTILPAAAPGFASAAYLTIALAVTAGLLTSIIAHELGHSLVAQRNNVGVSGITLFALGGVAKLEREPDDPGAAARIALAGPAVSVGIGVAALAAGFVASAAGVSALIAAGLTWLGVVNLSLAVFNMLPALPLDGGRALQAAMWKRSGDKDRATVSAASIGRYIGWAIVAFGAWQFVTGGSGLWTMIIGWFILSSAKAESMRAKFHIRRRNWAPPQAGFWNAPGASGHGGPTAAGATGSTARPTSAAASPFTAPNVIDVEGTRVS
jgi:Zn-dependent protease